MPRLRVESESLGGAEFEFRGDALVGRAPEADVRVMDYTVSRVHARLVAGKKAYRLDDLDSSNGCWVNGLEVSGSAQVDDGDSIQLGRVVLRFDWPKEERGRLRGGSTVRFDDRAKPVLLDHIDASEPVAALLASESDDETDQLRRRLELVFDVTRAIGGTANENELLSLILRKLFEILPQAERGLVLLRENGDATGKPRMLPQVALNRFGAPTDIAVSSSLVEDVLARRQGILSSDTTQDVRFSASTTMQRLQIRSLICVPIMTEEEAFGVLQLACSSSGSGFTRDDMALATAIAGQAGLFLANTRLHRRITQQQLLEKDLTLASKIQHRFLPESVPELPGYDFAVRYQPALRIGGDYYDFLDLGNGRLGIVVGDVSGKGISAALYMTKLASEMRYRASGRSDPAEILRRVNVSLSKDGDEGMFVTAFFLTLDPEEGRIEFANAGHPPPLLRRGGTVERISESPDAALGLADDFRFRTERRSLEPGDELLIYTDGVSEATDPQVKLYGERRLMKVFSSEQANGSSRATMERILTSVESFADGTPQADDLTVLVLRRVSSVSHP